MKFKDIEAEIEDGQTLWTTDDAWPVYLSPQAFAAAAPVNAGLATTSAAAPVATATTTATTSSDNPVLDNVIAHESGGVLGYAGAVAVLRAACQSLTTGVMNATLFSELTAVADDLANGSITATKYVKQIFDNVVLGNSANASWNGGDDQAIALGDLTATSRRWVFNDLINKWFLGADMPGLDSAPGVADDEVSYQTSSLPLFTSAGPQLTDVNQGQVGDCWFLAALSETAMLDPSLIEGMFTQHGNGSYAVRFEVNGQADFVTVNGELPNYSGNIQQFNSSQMAFANSTSSLWVPLLEKALAQLSEQSGVLTGMEYAGGDDQYYDLTGGAGEGMSLVTGQSYSSYYLGDENGSGTRLLLGTLESSLTAGNDVLLGTSDDTVGGNLVADHMFAVTAINSATNTVTLYNPWGSNASGEGLPESFSISANALVADQATFYAAYGAVKT